MVDTSIFIDFLRGRAGALTFLSPASRPFEVMTSVVVLAEVLEGVRNRSEQRDVDKVFAGFRVETITSADCDLSVRLLRTYKLSHGIGWLDCLIAATAIRLGVPVATLNEKHFGVIPGLSVYRPY